MAQALKLQKIVVDTNALVSAMVFGGKPRKITELAAGRKLKVVISAEVLLELDKVVGGKFPEFLDDLEVLRRFLLQRALVVRPTTLPQFQALRDANDAHILHAAKVTKADAIITGDKDLLTLGEFEKIPIITPGFFLDSLR